MKWIQGQPQAGTAPDALDGFSSHCAGDQLKLGANVAQVVPVSAAWRGDGAAQPSLEHGHHLNPFEAGLYVPSAYSGLVLVKGAQLTHPLIAGGGVLLGLLGGCLTRTVNQKCATATKEGVQFTSKIFTGMLKHEEI